MAIAFPTFFISYILYLRNSNKKIKKHELLILSLSSIYISQLKLVYLPVCLALFLIPDSKFTSKKKRILILMTIFIISILLNLIWLKISAQFLQSYRNSSQAQLKYIISNPHIYSFVCFIF